MRHLPQRNAPNETKNQEEKDEIAREKDETVEKIRQQFIKQVSWVREMRFRLGKGGLDLSSGYLRSFDCYLSLLASE
jgi:fructose-1,6-bisphosphatase